MCYKILSSFNISKEHVVFKKKKKKICIKKSPVIAKCFLTIFTIPKECYVQKTMFNGYKNSQSPVIAKYIVDFSFCSKSIANSKVAKFLSGICLILFWITYTFIVSININLKYFHGLYIHIFLLCTCSRNRGQFINSLGAWGKTFFWIATNNPLVLELINLDLKC